MDNEEEIHAAQARFVEEGYEGAMVGSNWCLRNRKAKCESTEKVKTFLDGEYPIVGFTQGMAEKQVVSFGSVLLLMDRPSESDQEEHRRTARCSLRTEVIMSDSN